MSGLVDECNDVDIEPVRLSLYHATRDSSEQTGKVCGRVAVWLCDCVVV